MAAPPSTCLFFKLDFREDFLEDFLVVFQLYLIAPQFLTAVRNSADPDSRPGLILVQSSKAGETSFTNYDDVNYREMQYHYNCELR